MDDKTKARIVASIARNPGYTAYQIAKNLKGVSRLQVIEVMEGREAAEAAAPSKSPAAATGGVTLSNRRVLSHKPQGSPIKAAIRRLSKNRAYPASELARSLGVSVDTLRKHAKALDSDHSLGCLRYVDMGEDEWVLCVLHPETAQSYE